MPDTARLLLQIGVIVAAARLAGWLFRKIGQPQVMGEMAAGILLGPSLLGWVLPGVSAFLFPPTSLGFLNALCQVGLVLYMFLVGLQLEPRLLAGRGRTAIVTSHASILAPFLAGTALALFLYPRLSEEGVPFSSFALFLGAAMSVTAFPVLARILTDRNFHRSPVGAVSLACAAVDDVTAWCLLAGVVILARAPLQTVPLPRTLAGLALFIALLLTFGRRLFGRFEETAGRQGSLTQDSLALILLCAVGCALTTELLGVHALFGAFIAGAAMPKGSAFVREVSGRLEDLAVVLLLPLFFAFTGLRTSVRLLNGAEAWLICGLIILVAVAGKLGGSALAARLSGMSWREAAAVGILMNTRGLMELVILNIGRDIGVLSRELFAMMVLMALVTTFMTSPLVDRVYPEALRRELRS
jgi:Kef-type K+ transport system membrane component KefB